MSIRGDWRALALALVVAVTVCAPAVALYAGPVIVGVVFLLSNPRSLRFDTATLLAIALPGFAALSLIWSVDRGVTLRGAISYAGLAAMFIGIRHVVKTGEQLRIVAVGYLAGCVALIVRLITLRIESPRMIRLNLADVNANYAGYSLVAGFAVIVLVYLLGVGTVGKILLGVTAVALIAGTFLAGTRAALVALAILVLWLAACRIFKRPPLTVLLVSVAAVCLGIVTGLADTLLALFETLFGRTTGDLSGRLTVWPLAREWWLEHFLIGSGASTFQQSNRMEIGAHNVVLELGAGMGIIGVAIFVAFLWFALRKQSAVLVGSLVSVTAASYLTGHWELAPAAWVLLGVFAVPLRHLDRVFDGDNVASTPSERR